MTDLFVVGGFTFMGLVCAALPFAFKREERRFKSMAIPVELRVIAVHIDEDFDSSGVSYRPEFEILSGPHKGHRQHSSSSSTFNPARVGDKVNGFYDPEQKRIESEATLANHRTFGWLAFAMSPILLGIAGFLYFI